MDYVIWRVDLDTPAELRRVISTNDDGLDEWDVDTLADTLTHLGVEASDALEVEGMLRLSDDNLVDVKLRDDYDSSDTNAYSGGSPSVSPDCTSSSVSGLASSQRKKTEAAKAHQRKGKSARRRKARQEAKADIFERKPQPSFTRHVHDSEVHQTHCDARLLPFANGAFVGKRLGNCTPRISKVNTLRARGYRYRAWNGRTTVIILDQDGRILVVLAGRPPSFDGVPEAATRAMETAAAACSFTGKQKNHRRGNFATLARGLSFGGGQKSPGILRNTAKNEHALAALCADDAMKRIAGFGSSIVAQFAPRVYDKMVTQLRPLFAPYTQAQLNFSNSIYPAATFNFGPRTVCLPHTDAANDPCNWCHITALGNFDPRHGGQLVLHTLKLIIEFPPGASICLPSALIEHSNLPIRPGEKRQSFTQYCAGGLMRWMAYGGRTEAEFAKDDPEGKAEFDASLSGRVEECLKLFTRYEEIQRARGERV